MDQKDLFKNVRKSSMSLDNVYFWTNTIKDWKSLLKQEKYKALIIEILRELSDRQLIFVYGFVIMPNHLHLLWEMKNKNGKEMPHASFNKTTSRLIKIDLGEKHPQVLSYFKVDEKERTFRFWQRDPLAVLMDSKEKFEQKLDYIHLNPLQERWNLAKSPEDYLWSSAKFYETGQDDFGFLIHYMERF